MVKWVSAFQFVKDYVAANIEIGIYAVSLYADSSKSDDKSSNGAAIGITFTVTLILSVAFTLLVVCIVYKVWIEKQRTWIVNQKTTTDVADNVPLSAEPMVSADDSMLHDFPDDDQSMRYQSNPLATSKPVSANSEAQIHAKDDYQVYDIKK